MRLLQPWAMLAKGPPCTSAGVPSMVCTRFGLMASFKSAAIAPCACRSRTYTGSPRRFQATIIAPRRSFRSARSRARQKAAMTSLATVMSKPSGRRVPSTVLPRPLMMWRSWRSFISTARRQVMRFGSMSSALPWWMWLSMSAARRLLAAPMAWKSPVKCRLMSSIGSTCA